MKRYHIFIGLFIGIGIGITIEAIFVAYRMESHQEVMATLSGLYMQISEENSQCMFLLDKYIK